MEKQKTSIKDNSGAAGYQIAGMYISEFSLKINDEFKKLDSSVPGGFKNFTFEITCINSVLLPQNILNIQVAVKVFLDSGKTTQLGFLSLTNLFKVNDLKNYVNEKSKTYTLPPEMETVFIEISLSHARAVLYSKCAGTFLQNALMPVVDPKIFVSKRKK